MDPHVLFRGLVVDEPKDVVFQHRAPAKLSEEYLAGITRADDQGTSAFPTTAPALRFAHNPQREPHATDQRKA